MDSNLTITVLASVAAFVNILMLFILNDIRSRVVIVEERSFGEAERSQLRIDRAIAAHSKITERNLRHEH